MRLNVISLAHRPERRAQFMLWNERPGLDIQFIEAVNGKELDRANLVSDGLLSAENRTFSPGALGHAMSNHALWRLAQNAGGPTFVCEDDACLRGDFITQAPALLAQLPADWDFVFFGYNTDATVAVEGPEGIKAVLFWNEGAKKTPGYFDVFAKKTGPAPTPVACFQAWGTLCYAISPAGAGKLLKHCFPLNSALDLVMFGQNRSIKAYTLNSMMNVALQRDPIAAYCAYPPLALGPNDPASSDIKR
jgi:GR25 family glycosyltransferase involved in LPS biosynthesis